jgi:uncharacterized protein
MKKTLFLSVALLFAFSIFAQEGMIPVKPEPAQFVNDYAEVIPAEQEALLEQKLKDFDQATSNQFAIVIIKSLKNNNLEKLATQWFKAWGIGQKDKNNGVLILVAVEDRKMRIEVGYGLESTITNAEADKAIQTLLKPSFRSQEYYTGLKAATSYLMDLAKKAYNQPQTATTASTQSVSQNMQTREESEGISAELAVALIVAGIVLFMVLIGIILYRLDRGRKSKKVYTSSSSKSSSSNNHYTSNNDTHTYTSGYTSYDSSSSSSYDSSSSSSDSSSYGGGDSGGGGSSGDW